MDWTGLDWTGGERSVSEWEWARSQSEADGRRLREGRASAVRLRLGSLGASRIGTKREMIRWLQRGMRGRWPRVFDAREQAIEI